MTPYRRTAALLVTLAACSGGDTSDSAEPASEQQSAEPAAEPTAGAAPAQPGGPLSMPDWYALDESTGGVTITLTSGSSNRNNYWNYNGAISGELAITVPVGAEVSIALTNEDPNMAHSVGVSELPANLMMPPAPVPLFEGAITENPQSMTDGVLTGESETITFVADQAGEFALLCYIPGHTAVGMWLFFNVSADGEAGVQGL